MTLENIRKVLIVEDEKPIQKALEIKFLASGFEVKTADDGQAALDMLASYTPDIILLDIIMPVKDGIAVLHELKAKPEWAKIPVILLTNLNDPDKITEAVAMGVKDYAVKSDWKIEDVVDKVKQRLLEAQ